MVKVIDPTPDPMVVKRISCRNCGARLEYVPNDIRERRHTDYTGSCDVYDVIVCPNCKKDVYV